MINSQQIFTTKVLLGNRILYAKCDIDAMKNINNMLMCQCMSTNCFLLPQTYNAILSTKWEGNVKAERHWKIMRRVARASLSLR